jgi:endonuclease/exonuclease/phosphatase family metal-dependent hydrolase
MRASSLLLLPALCSGCGEAPLEPREPTPGVPHFVIQTYNVELHAYDDAATVAAVGAANADVIALQETTANWQRVLADTYGDEYPYMLFHGQSSSGDLAILSRFPLEDRGVLPGPNGWHPAWHVLVDSPVGPVQLLNVHLRSYFNGTSNTVESYLTVGDDHLESIEYFTEECDPDGVNVVLGDFNEDEDGPAVRYLEERGYEDALPLYHPGQGTWRHASLAGQLTKALDHIVFDGRLRPLNAWVEVAGNSDHIPVIAHLEGTQNE